MLQVWLSGCAPRTLNLGRAWYLKVGQVNILIIREGFRFSLANHMCEEISLHLSDREIASLSKRQFIQLSTSHVQSLVVDQKKSRILYNINPKDYPIFSSYRSQIDIAGSSVYL